FALMAFAAGFLVRPFGALVFGRLGDMIGRKYTFLVTIVLMGLSTFAVGLLPTYASIGIAAPIILVGLRMLQGLALG
ncbi:MFS transporter, partial [Pseudomonas frederiksbergensis]|nr:MFS transporter [Pseudomonas frederiksbergensis]